jgi:hypothetical protein
MGCVEGERVASKASQILAVCATFTGIMFSGPPVFAQSGDTLQGTLQLGYSNYDASGHSTSDWTASGSAVFIFDNPGFNLQINAINDNLNTPAFTATAVDSSAGTSTAATTRSSGAQWRYGGDLFWRDDAGIIGINATTDKATANSHLSTVTTDSSGIAGTPVLTSSNSSSTFENVGLFGEYFVLSDLTLRAKGGWLAGDDRGYYADGALVYYPYRQIAVSAGAGYAVPGSGLSAQDATADLEYMPVPSMPFSLKLEYTYARYRGLASGHENDNVLAAVLKVYLGERGGTLRDYQRSGTTDWDGTQPAFGRFGF